MAINTFWSTFKEPHFCEMYKASVTFIGLLLCDLLTDEEIEVPGKLDKTEIK